jgi:hypothetical protein
VGIILGVSIMLIPSFLYILLGPYFPAPDQPLLPAEGGGFYGGGGVDDEPSPVDVTGDIIWLFLPAFIIAAILYFLLARRTRWAGYDEAVKWIRR